MCKFGRKHQRYLVSMNTRRLPELAIVTIQYYDSTVHFFTTITTQNTFTMWESNFWTYTPRHRLPSHSTLQAVNADGLRSGFKYFYYLTNVLE